MKDVCEIDGQVWRDIETLSDADYIGFLSKTAVKLYFDLDRNRFAATSGEVPEPKYYALMPDEQHVCAVVLCVNSLCIPQKTLVTGFQNGNPFPKFGAKIDALAQIIGVELSERYYPYTSGAAVDVAAAKAQHDVWSSQNPGRTI